MIYIADRHVEDYLHVLANLNTVRIFREAFSEEKICFISAQAHNLKVKTLLNDTDPLTEFRTFKNRRPVKNLALRALSLTKRAVDDIFYFKRLFDRSTPEDILVISHIYPHSLIFFNLLKRFYPRRVVLIMLHGEVEYTLFAYSSTQKLIGAIYKLCFRITPSRLNYIFLTKASCNIIEGADIFAGAKPICIELPTMVAGKIITPKDNDGQRPVKIGHIGSAGKRKNVDQLYVLADMAQDLIADNSIQFSVVGVLEASIKQYLTPLVINFVNDQINEPIDRDAYDEEASRLDYAIFFYSTNDFLLRSSAAFFDAVLHEVPIIAFKNRFFTDLLETHGAMGYLCGNLNDMQAVIHKIVSEPEVARRHMADFKRNIRVYKSTLSISSIAIDLKMQLKGLLPDAMMKE
ncbi:hypothetical protein [Mucilaginibacter sp.]|uniref:hypothetical protein n=1 Tax=Mucilaginibacter sp. TaxID=1882438 RepID=UPI00284280FF|nr:hypothetical protein [Mucilaginibacter sp.]MDR3694919.1 hypothetical protein [Mucilaginibacter sp.]